MRRGQTGRTWIKTTDREQFYPLGGEREEADETPKTPGDGYLSYPRKQEASGKRGPGSVRCYSCSKMGHLSWNGESTFLPTSWKLLNKTAGRPDSATFQICGGKRDSRHCTGHRVLKDDDMAWSRQQRYGTDGVVIVQCAHGDTVTYPLAVVELTVNGLQLRVEAALSDTLPTAVLLRRDMPELNQLLGARGCKAREPHDG